MQSKQDTKHEADKLVRDIKRATRQKFSAEEKIRIVLAGLRGEDSIAELSYGHDLPMVLLNDVAQVFALADFNTFVMVTIKLVQTRLIGTTLIDIHQTGYAVLSNGFFQKA